MAKSLAKAVKELAREPVRDRDSSYKDGHELKQRDNSNDMRSQDAQFKQSWRGDARERAPSKR
jgi:hypothetical protein